MTAVAAAIVDAISIALQIAALAFFVRAAILLARRK